MVGTLRLYPCFCLEALPSTNMSFKSSGDMGFYRSSVGRKQLRGRTGQVELTSSFVDAWYEWRLSSKVLSAIVNGCLKKKKQPKVRGLVIVNELAGQYEDSFDDVKTQILNYFTYKAVRTVLNQLYEMNPTHYRWFYNFIVANKPGDGKRFIRTLNKEKQELAERVMVTRLHLYGKWIKEKTTKKEQKRKRKEKLRSDCLSAPLLGRASVALVEGKFSFWRFNWCSTTRLFKLSATLIISAPLHKIHSATLNWCVK